MEVISEGVHVENKQQNQQIFALFGTAPPVLLILITLQETLVQ